MVTAIKSSPSSRNGQTRRQQYSRGVYRASRTDVARELGASRLPDPDETRRLIALGRERGLIKFAGDKVAIEKNGADISTLGPLRSQWLIVTPALAKKWLANNFRNRPLRQDTIKAYARDMINGQWVYTHQGIAFNDKDELIDGQHRLHAIVLANVELRMMVTFGLPKLKVGECYIWSPQWLEISEKIKIASKKTADVSSTPKPGVKPIEPKQLSQIELENLSDKMLATIERAKQEDPKELRKQNAELKRELAVAQNKASVAELGLKQTVKEKIIEKPVLKDSQLKRAEKIIDRAQSLFASSEIGFRDCFQKFSASIAPIREALDSSKFANTEPRPVSTSLAVAKRAEASKGLERDGYKPLMRNRRAATPSPIGSTASDTISFGLGERRCGIAIAQHGSVSREQLTVLTGYKRSSRNTYLQRMRSAGLTEDRGDRVYALPALAEWLGNDYEPLPTGPALQTYWLQRLPEGERRIFDIVLQNPAGVGREELDELTGYKRSSRNTYLQRLRSRELVTFSGESVLPSENVL